MITPHVPPSPAPGLGHFRGLDHLALVVPSTEEALRVWRDRWGFPVLTSEVVADGALRLTHLDLGGAQLQLVEPLTAEHPLRDWLVRHGPGLHHLCLRVDRLDEARAAFQEAGWAGPAQPHAAVGGRRALFLDPTHTGGVPTEIVGD